MKFVRAVPLLILLLALAPQASAQRQQQYGPSWQNFQQGTIMPPIQPNYGGNRYVAPQYVPPPPYQPYNQGNPFSGQPNNPYANPPPQVT